MPYEKRKAVIAFRDNRAGGSFKKAREEKQEK